jgi:hypothetical protein
MTYTTLQEKTLNLNESHRSNGSELIPAEVQANIRHDDAPSIDTPSLRSYTVDDEGLINNYAIEPDLSRAEYPSPRQQQRYIFLGAGAVLFVVALILIAFTVS